jgi:hypothetical protein
MISSKILKVTNERFGCTTGKTDEASVTIIRALERPHVLSLCLALSGQFTPATM